jgi:hypothetical protein
LLHVLVLGQAVAADAAHSAWIIGWQTHASLSQCLRH